MRSSTSPILRRLTPFLSLILDLSQSQTHVLSPHHDLVFSQVALPPIDEYLAVPSTNENDDSYQDARDELLYNGQSDIESFVSFDLSYSWLVHVDDYLSSATLRLYLIRGQLENVDFDVLIDDDNDDEWNLQVGGLDCLDSKPCWMDIDLTDGLLWSIEQQPDISSITVRISVDDSTDGAFASSRYDNGSLAPELILDFDRHENLEQIQVELMQLRRGTFRSSKSKTGPRDKKKIEKKKGKKSKMKINNEKVKNKPDKKSKKPGKKSKKPGKKEDKFKPKPNISDLPGKDGKKPSKPRPTQNKDPNKNDKLKPNNNGSDGKPTKPSRPTIDSDSNTIEKPSISNIGKGGPTFDEDFSITSESSASKRVLEIIERKSWKIDNNLFLYESPADGWIPSSIYKSDGLLKGLEIMNKKGVNKLHFYLGGEERGDYKYGLTNVAAFLAQSMKETIKYDACDENSWDLVNGRYPLSNACGQLHQSYQDYHCPEHERHMECPVDPNMEITAVTHAKWYGAPAPLFCKPKKNKNDFTGSWNYGFFCNVPWVDPPITCDDYEGQTAGRFENDEPVANRNGRTDVEGCCWWGRGVIQTTGVCNFGKLNYYLGARAAKEGRDAPYAQYDFCKNPEIICSSKENKELKWIAGMFYWMESVQKYNSGGWNYMTELKAYVDGGFSDSGFINAVSGIVNRGCHNPPCGSGAVDGGPERATNFQHTLGTFGLIEMPEDDEKGGIGAAKGLPKSVCGIDWLDASKCKENMRECLTQLDCPQGHFCWAGVVC